MIIRELGIKRIASPCDFNLFLNPSTQLLSYAGIGSRNTPLEIGEVMIKVGYYFGLSGFSLRSGGAEGADTFFEIGADLARSVDQSKGLKQIFLPEKDFFKQNHPSDWYANNPEIYTDEEARKELEKELLFLAGRFHKGLASMSENGRGLMIRNGQQVLGPFLNDPSMIVICWTPDGAINDQGRNRMTGGTGQAISIASCEYLITGKGETRYLKDEPQQVINLQRPDHLAMITEKLKELEEKYGTMPDWKTTLNWTPILTPKKNIKYSI